MHEMRGYNYALRFFPAATLLSSLSVFSYSLFNKAEQMLPDALCFVLLFVPYPCTATAQLQCLPLHEIVDDQIC
jgi:hypothetical protein